MSDALSVTPEEQADVERAIQQGIRVYEGQALVFHWHPSRKELIEWLTVAKVSDVPFGRVLLIRAEVERVVGQVRGRPWDTTNYTGERAPGQ